MNYKPFIQEAAARVYLHSPRAPPIYVSAQLGVPRRSQPSAAVQIKISQPLNKTYKDNEEVE